MSKFYIGAAYYPELWDRAEIDRDIEKMKAYGMNTMRIGEFAWSTMEKREGEFDFELFLYVIDKLYENGIYTVMCTPTCTPPRWLFAKYPEVTRVLSTQHMSVKQDIRSRCHPCKSNELMREKNRVIVREMAKAVGNHPGVIGWQIDNELFPYDDGCYCESCIRGFREHLAKKFGTVDALNRAWGMYRWSLNYNSFDEVIPPRPNRWEHPSLQVEWIRFQSELIVSYVNEQAEEIRKYSSAPIGTDMMTNNQLSYVDVNRELDIIQYNHYNAPNALNEPIFAYSFLRTLKDRPFWVTETQVGWNGGTGAWNGARHEGNCYINTVAPIACGAEMNLYWLFRAHPNGHELAHGAFLNSAGRPYRISEEIKRASDDLAKCEDFLANSVASSKIALHYSSTAVKQFRFAPLIELFDYRANLFTKFYDPLRPYNPDVIETDKALDGYEVVVTPFLTCATENGLKERIVKWVEEGGRWIVGPLSDIMDEHTSKYTHAPFSFLEELAGVYTKFQAPTPVEDIHGKWIDGDDFSISLCCDVFEATDCDILARYEGGEFNGMPAIVRRKVGKGEVILLGTVPSKEALRHLIGRDPIACASENMALVKRSGKENGIVALELNHEPGYVKLDKPYYDILGEKTVSGKVEVPPYTALFLKEIE